jgi:hypothetical protein
VSEILSSTFGSNFGLVFEHLLCREPSPRAVLKADVAEAEGTRLLFEVALVVSHNSLEATEDADHRMGEALSTVISGEKSLFSVLPIFLLIRKYQSIFP